VIALGHRVRNEVSTRRLRMVKYRGSAHGTNEYPFLITACGFSVMPGTAATLDYGASDERISTGVPDLDDMLAGGPFRGSAVLVSGPPGTGKTTLGAHLIDAACARGERALLILFEESPDEVVPNMRSVGLDLRRWAEAGLLRMWAVRAAEFGLDNHLAMVSGLVAEHAPTVAVIDGIGSLLIGHARGEVSLMLARKFHLFKEQRITTLATVLTEPGVETAEGVSSRADTWLLLRHAESRGELDRLLFVLKQRGTVHSDQVRGIVLTSHGVELGDVYAGPKPVMTGSARLAQGIGERDAKLHQQADMQHRARELRRDSAHRQAQVAALQKEIAAQQAELEQLADREELQAADAADARRATGTRRWADPLGADGEEQR